MVHIPVPYTIFGDIDGRISCIEYLDKAFDYARQTHIKILIDLHSVPGGQNGFDNSGTCGLCTWHTKDSYYQETMRVLKQLALRNKGREELFGIQPMNEPANTFIFNLNKGLHKNRYPERVSISSVIPRNKLEEFYLDVYNQIMPILGKERALVLHDQFEPMSWNDFMPKEEYPNIYMDTHMYLNFSEYGMPTKNLENYLDVIQNDFSKTIEYMEQAHPTIVGEWCLAQHMNGLKEADKETKRFLYKQIADAQLQAWQKGHGGIFWSYDLEAQGKEDWSFIKSVENRWLSYK